VLAGDVRNQDPQRRAAGDVRLEQADDDSHRHLLSVLVGGSELLVFVDI
jgi:hypothetical protein